MSRTVLCVDDDPDDRELIRDAIFNIDPSYQMVFAENGKEALSYLKESLSSELPCLVILDINMPVMDGKQAITEIKTRPEFRQIPLVVFTTSNHPADISFCKRFDVELILKPTSLNQISREAERLLHHCAEN